MVYLTMVTGDDLSTRLKEKMADLDAVLRLIDLTLERNDSGVFENKIARLVKIALRYTEKCEKYRSELHDSTQPDTDVNSE